MMWFSPQIILGVDVEESLIRLSALSLQNNQWQVHGCREFARASFSAAELELHFNKQLIKNALVVTALNSAEVLSRPLELHLLKQKDVDAAYEFQAEPLLPYPLEDAVVEKVTVSTTESSTRLNILATRKEAIAQHLEMLQALQIDSERLSSIPLALATLSAFLADNDQPSCLMHVGETTTTFVVAQKGVLLHSFSFERGSKDLPSEFTPNTASALADYVKELSRTFFALKKQTALSFNRILLSGVVAKNPTFPELLTQHLSLEVSPLQKHIDSFADIDLSTYAVSIGLAIASQDETVAPDFRKKEFAYPRPWKRLKKRICLQLSLGLILALSLWAFGQGVSNYQVASLRKEYRTLLSTLRQSHQEIEEKMQHSSRKRKQIVPLDKLGEEEIRQRLNFINQALRKTTYYYPFQANTPLVSETLAWLSNHPVVLAAQKEADPATLPFKIEKFSYTVTKRPSLDRPKEHYKVRVDIEFSAVTPRIAREFHDALVEPNDFIDPNEEVRWSAQKNRYMATFFLKDKTVYVSTP